MASIRKRGKRWQAQVRRAGVDLSATFDTKAAAEKWARRIERDADEGKAIGGSRAHGTVGQLLDAYEVKARELKPLGRGKVHVLGQLRAGLGEISLRKLSADHVLEHCKRRRDAGAGPVTIGLDLSALGTALRASRALLGVELSDEPAKAARTALKGAGLAGRSQQRDRRPTTEELARLRAHWTGNARQTTPLADLMDFAAITGFRREEIARLRWADLDEAAGTIVIRDRKDPRRKTGNHQRVPLLFGALDIIRRQPRGEEVIFKVKAESISTLFARACNAVGVIDLRFHDLRHHAISCMFERGMALPEVAIVSGHKTWAMLARYTHLKAEDVARRYSSAPEPSATPRGSPDDTGSSDQP